MGKTCTRACGFCEIAHNKAPPALEEDEPLRLAESVKALGLKHVVITMVARDDLADGGASHLKRIVECVRQLNPNVTVELLTSDFEGNFTALSDLLTCQPEIFNHNIETTEILTPRVRHKATYRRSLEILRFAKESKCSRFIKSGLMVGLGESEEDVFQALADLKSHGCDIVTIGQYLQASRHKLRVKDFIPPEQFERYKAKGLELGLSFVYAGPFVRSSYNAGLVFEEAGTVKSIESS
jgi:lipoate synthase